MSMLLLGPEILPDRTEEKKKSKTGGKGVGEQPDNLI